MHYFFGFGVAFCLFMAGFTYNQFLSAAEAQIPADVPRCMVHGNANNIVQCQMPNGVTCYYKEGLNAVSMDCMER